MIVKSGNALEDLFIKFDNRVILEVSAGAVFRWMISWDLSSNLWMEISILDYNDENQGDGGLIP